MRKTNTIKRRATQRASFSMAGGDVNTSMFWFGDLNLWGAFPTAPTVYQKPRAQIFYATRNWFERSVFIKSMTLLRFALFNYGFKVVSRKKESEERVQKWADKNESLITSFLRDAWNEWMIQDNAVALWRTNNGRPLIYPTEHIAYNDEYGIERLSFAHGLTAASLATMPNLTDAEKKRIASDAKLSLMKQGKVYDQNLFEFEVVKRTRVGMGLAWPKLRSIFNTVACWESLEMADWQLAESMRTIYELHSVGHEIKNGPLAGRKTHFINKTRAEAIKKVIKGDKQLMARIIQMVVNFDHTITWPRPDVKHFSEDRYTAALNRFIIWAGPLGQMLFAKTVNPFLMPIFKAEVLTERDYLRVFCRTVFRETLKMPDDADLTWGEDIFWDSRLLLQVLKDGLTAGPLSQTTWMRSTGFNPDVERTNKDKESKLPDHQVKPIYDPSHGDVEQNGRPVGKSDKKARKTKEKK